MAIVDIFKTDKKEESLSSNARFLPDMEFVEEEQEEKLESQRDWISFLVVRLLFLGLFLSAFFWALWSLVRWVFFFPLHLLLTSSLYFRSRAKKTAHIIFFSYPVNILTG